MQEEKPSDWKRFGAFVRERRGPDGLNLSAQDVAEVLGTSAVFVYKLETGERPLPVKGRAARLEGLAGLLKCNVKDLESLIPSRRPLRDTVRQARSNKSQADALKLRAEELGSQDAARREGLLAQQQLVRASFVDPYTELAVRIPDLQQGLGPEVPRQVFGSIGVGEQTSEQWKVIAGALGAMAGSTAMGTAAGGAAALGLYAGVAAFGTASTGASIAGLSGAAASSATLAALGGGSLAAGGWGVVGGTALLVGVAAVPAVMALGVGALVADRYAYGKLLELTESLDDFEEILDSSEQTLRIRWAWADQQRKILSTILAAVARPLVLLQRDIGTGETSTMWVEVPTESQRRMQYLAVALTLAIEALCLPTWTPIDEGDLVLQERHYFDERYVQLNSDADALLGMVPD